MEDLNNLYHKDIEIESQINLVLRDIVNEGIEHLENEENRDSIISSAVAALDSVLKDREKGLENKIKSKEFNNKPNRMTRIMNKSYENMKTIVPKLYDLLKKALKGYEFKKEFMGGQAKKINDYLKRHTNMKNLHLKGVKFGIGIWDAWVFGKNLYDIWVEQDKNYFEKIKETRKAILGFIGETIFGSIGVEIGVGLMNPGVWQFIMVFCLAYFLSKLGGWIFGKINDLLENIGKKLAGIDGDNGGDEGLNGIRFFNFPRRRRDDDDDDDGGDPPFPPCPAFAVSMRSGGAEFHLPRQINNFTSFFSFNKCHYIAFEYEDLDIEEIINLVNSKFLINNIILKLKI